ncbi:MAG: FecR domain-containing protein [Pseudoxanthomonas sp.]
MTRKVWVDNDAIEQAAADWLARRDSHAWNDAEQARFEAWLAAATAHKVAWLRLDTAWHEAGRLKALGAGIAPGIMPPRGQWSARPGTATPAAGAPALGDVAALRFAPRPTPPRPRGWLRAIGFAAVFALIGALGWTAFRHAPTEQADYATTTGELRTLALGDGSQVTLGSDSRIAVSFSRAQRDIELQRGEAFFIVAKDASRPFVVAAGPRRATAVGTRYAVRRDDANLRVVVTEGTVQLDADGQPTQPTTLLPAGSIAVAGAEGLLVRQAGLDEAERALDWRSGLLSFDDTPLAEAAAEFNRYNTRKLVIADADAAALRIGGSFRWNNVDAFARLLERGFPLRAEADGERIVLHSR